MRLEAGRRRLKGFETLPLTAFLIIIIVGVVMLNITFWGEESLNERTMPLKNDVYFVRNALDIASSYFLQECFRVSLVQSMHNNSARGGWLQIPAGSALGYRGKSYALWSYNGRDLSPSAKEFSDAFWQSFVMNLGQSLKGGEASILVRVTLPEYRPEDISIADSGKLKVHVEAKASSPLTATKRNGEDLIELYKSADVSRDFDSPYFLLFEKAKELHGKIGDRMNICTPDEIRKIFANGRNEATAFYSATTAVIQDYGTNGRCLVMVEIATAQKYLISDNRTLLYQPIKFVFFESMDDDFRKCLNCRISDKNWCIEGKSCEDIRTGEAACSGKPAITGSCYALSRTSCEDCLSAVPEGEDMVHHWLWCKPEGVCAQSCPGDSVADPGGCQAEAAAGQPFREGDRILDPASGDALFAYDEESGTWFSGDGAQYGTEDVLTYIDTLGNGFLFMRADGTASQYAASVDMMRDLEGNGGDAEPLDWGAS